MTTTEHHQTFLATFKPYNYHCISYWFHHPPYPSFTFNCYSFAMHGFVRSLERESKEGSLIIKWVPRFSGPTKLLPTPSYIRIYTSNKIDGKKRQTDALDQLGYLDFVVTFFQNRFKCLSIPLKLFGLNLLLAPPYFWICTISLSNS